MPNIRYKSFPLWAIYVITGSVIVFFFWYLRSPPPEVNVPSGKNARAFKIKKLTQYKDSNLDFRKVIEAMNEQRTPMDDKKLVDIIRDHFIYVPSDDDTYNLLEPRSLGYSSGETSHIDQRLQAMERGFYVETRAFTGERESTTLFFEKVRQWNGLLVEPDPIKFQLLKSKNRKAFLLNACLNDKQYPTKMTLYRPDGTDLSKPGTEKYEAQCFPLYSVLLALDQRNVTFLSLNFYESGSGSQSELDILKSLPFEHLNVTFVGIRNYYANKGRQGPVEVFMEEKGYEMLGRLRTSDQWVNDLVFLDKHNTLAAPVFWTRTNIFRAVVMFCVLYGIANVLAYKYLFPRLHLYKVAYGIK